MNQSILIVIQWNQILRCHIPSFAREYVHVTNWLRYGDDDHPIISDLLKESHITYLGPINQSWLFEIRSITI
ncbi:hypothetical protein BLA29_012326 [Euroglyphus maynei]|uniref:Uncharacterized protein n=1 Tax=Euroglyphus maynei TaxID=6958 RepID=A0A1Y3AKK4_EURMA|nr:hypothetical protein BLA29_012326 [Euroglyphus maynei]